MADGYSIDVSDVFKAAAQMDRVKDELPKGTAGAARGAAYTTKEAWQEGLETSEFPASASSIAYSLKGTNAASVRATIENSQGTARAQGFVHAAEYGSPTVSPRGYAQAGLQRGVADFEKGLSLAAQRAVERALRG